MRGRKGERKGGREEGEGRGERLEKKRYGYEGLDGRYKGGMRRVVRIIIIGAYAKRGHVLTPRLFPLFSI